MRALVLQDWWQLAVEDVPEPQPEAEVLIRPIATGICGSDVHGYTGENGRRVFGQVMGHETVARVEAIGADIVDPSFAVGDVVTMNPVIGCGNCALCLGGNPQACATKAVIGVTPSYTSTFAELVVVPAATSWPSGLGHRRIRRTGRAARGGLPRGSPRSGRRRRSGTRRRRRPHRAVLCARRATTGRPPRGGHRAESAPPRPVCDARRRSARPDLGDGLPAAVTEALGRRPGVVLDAVGTTGSMTSALQCAPLMSTVVLVGMGHQRLELPAYEVSTKERTVVGSFCYTPAEFADTAAWVGTTERDLGALIQERVDLAGANAAFDALARGDGTLSKVLVMIQD